MYVKHSKRNSIELANADISRLMDPAYYPHNHHSEPARAYVDHRGEMHDPDYQDFPVFPVAGKTSRGRRRSSDPMRTRPQWEQDGEVDMEEYEEEEERHFQSGRHLRNNVRPRSAQHSPARDYYPSAHSPSASSSITSSPSSSYSPLPPYISVFEEKPHSHHCLLPKRFRRHSSCSQEHQFSHDSYDDSYGFEDEYEAEEEVHTDVAERDRSIVRSQMTDLSYSQAIKKQWLAVSLSVQVQLFRARKRASSHRSRKD
ncbi:hypothetical protein D9757_004760 [Collybiopsis confluens]|uniref:Uncharacterized protein n=1 Tax=Collybiopsis confluens TaxID=2823264 RepID=A0A8H5HSP1_9AGAR|nr:hypothetical protein D9757_004760 [Collybiopsis confluens]